MFGKGQRDVDLKALSVGLAADDETRGKKKKTRLGGRFSVKTALCFKVCPKKKLPNELARGITQGPEHVKTHFPQEDESAAPAVQ